MYAVFEDGSRQYKVSVGEVVRVDYREGEQGSRVEFGRVLLYREGAEVKIGQPVLEGMRVVGEILDHPSEKTYIQHFRRRKNYRRLKGHRQYFTSVKVQHILQAGEQPPAPAENTAPKPAEAPTGSPPSPSSVPTA